jgi:hypothetical protein
MRRCLLMQSDWATAMRPKNVLLLSISTNQLDCVFKIGRLAFVFR